MKVANTHNLSECTPTEVFATIARHLLTQKVPAKEEDMCMYRTESGLKCAAGCLIPDDVYNADFEGTNWDYLVNGKQFPSAHMKLIGHLQGIHDKVPPSSWKDVLIATACHWDIDTAVLEGLQSPSHHQSPSTH